jgi:hypothetical protein
MVSATLDPNTGKSVLQAIIKGDKCSPMDISLAIPDSLQWLDILQEIGVIYYRKDDDAYRVSDDFRGVSTPKLKQFCDRMGIETNGHRSKKITFIEAIQAYLDQPIEVPIQEIANRDLCTEDYEAVGLVLFQAIVIVAIVSFKIGWYLGDLIAVHIVPMILKWKHHQDWDQMKQRLFKKAREVDPTI